MKNIKLLKLAAIFAIASFSSQAMAEKVLKIGTWLPPTHFMNAEVLPTWGKWIEEATEGRVIVNIENYNGHPKALFDLVQDGVYDSSWSFHGYVPGRFKLTKIVEIPGLDTSAEAASVAHWRVHQKYLAKAGEHRGLVLAALFAHAPGQIHLREPISSLSELEGKKIRIGGGIQTDIANTFGVKGVTAPAGKVYEMLSQGVADGVFFPMGEKNSLRITEIAPFTLKVSKGIYLGSFSLVLNEDFMNSLSQADRDAIMSVSGEKLSALAGGTWDKDSAKGEAAAIEFGNTIKIADDAMVKEFNDKTAHIEKEWIESNSNVDAAAALKELREIARSY